MNEVECRMKVKNNLKIGMTMAAVLMFNTCVYAEPLDIKLNGLITSIENSVVDNDKTVVSLIELCEKLGITREVVGVGKLKLTKGDITVIVTCNSDKIIKNGEEMVTQNFPYLLNDVCVISMNFFEEVFDFKVGWDSISNAVTVQSSNEYDIWEMLEKAERVGEELTIEKALELVLQNNKDYNRSVKNYEEDEKDLYESNLWQGATYTNYLKGKISLKGAKRSIEKMVKNYELQLKNTFISILNAEMSLAQSKYAIELEKKNLDIAKQRYALGMISTQSLNNTQSSYDKNLEKIEDAEKSLKETYENLNEFMGVEKEKEFVLKYDILYEPVCSDFDISKHKKSMLNNAYSIKSQEDSIDTKEIPVTYYGWFGVSENYSYSDALKDLEEAEEDYEDYKKDFLEDIDKTFEGMQDLEKDYDEAVKDLEKAIEDYEIIKLKYNLGSVTKLELENAKTSIISAQISIQKLVYEYDLAWFKFNTVELN